MHRNMYDVTRTHREGRIQVDIRLTKAEVMTTLRALEYELDTMYDGEQMVGPPSDTDKLARLVDRYREVTVTMLEATPEGGQVG